jgi:uncharacterized membrane protein YdjX (TVP38/TMEM64 family)
VLTLAAGAVFGALTGTVYVNIGATVGATLAFLVARYLFRDFIQTKFGTRIEKINTELETRGFNYLLFLRLVPLFPFFLINLGAGLTRIPLRTFFLGTMIGIIRQFRLAERAFLQRSRAWAISFLHGCSGPLRSSGCSRYSVVYNKLSKK